MALSGGPKSLSRRTALLGVCPSEEGLAAAVVRREPGVPPTLDFCKFLPLALQDNPARVLQRLIRTHRLAQLDCASALEMDSYSLLLVEAPDVPAAELKGAIRWRVKDLIDFPVDEAVIDFFELPPQKNVAAGRMLYVVAARAELVKQRADSLLDAGVKLAAIDIPELGMRNLAALLPEDVGGTAFIYLGRHRGILTLTRQGTLYFSRRLQTGTDILRVRNVDSVTPEIEGWLDSIIIEVQRSLDYYESHFTAPPIAGLVLAPFGRPIAGITEYLSGQLGLRCRELHLNELIDMPEALGVEQLAQCLPAIATALRLEADAA